MSVKCRKYSDKELQAYLDKEFQFITDKNSLSKHLTQCTQCRERYEELRSYKDKFNTLLARGNTTTPIASLENEPTALSRFLIDYPPEITGHKKFASIAEELPALSPVEELSNLTNPIPTPIENNPTAPILTSIHSRQEKERGFQFMVSTKSKLSKVRRRFIYLPVLASLVAVVIGLLGILAIGDLVQKPTASNSLAQNGGQAVAIVTPLPTLFGSNTECAGGDATGCSTSKAYPLNISQSSNGITLTLTQAYFGSDGAFVRYEVSGNIKDSVSSVPISIDPSFSLILQDTLALSNSPTKELMSDNHVDYMNRGIGPARAGSFFKVSSSDLSAIHLDASKKIGLRYTVISLNAHSPTTDLRSALGFTPTSLSPTNGTVTGSPFANSIIKTPLIFEFEIPYGAYK